MTTKLPRYTPVLVADPAPAPAPAADAATGERVASAHHAGACPVTRWRVVRAPVSRYQDGPRFSVLSDRAPGPMPGELGGLRGWVEVYHEPGGLTFEAACQLAADGNGKPSTANMGPQHAAERAGAT